MPTRSVSATRLSQRSLRFTKRWWDLTPSRQNDLVFVVQNCLNRHRGSVISSLRPEVAYHPEFILDRSAYNDTPSRMIEVAARAPRETLKKRSLRECKDDVVLASRAHR